MNTSFSSTLDLLFLHWKKQDIELNASASIDAIRQLETLLSISFEVDFHTYLLKLNGFADFDTDETMFSFWSKNRIIEENNDGSHPKELIWFSDYCINLCAFGFHKQDKKIYSHFQGSEELLYIADSFKEFMEFYQKDPDLLIK